MFVTPEVRTASIGNPESTRAQRSANRTLSNLLLVQRASCAYLPRPDQFEAEATEIQAAMAKLAESLARLNKVAAIIGAVASALGVVERIITLLA